MKGETLIPMAKAGFEKAATINNDSGAAYKKLNSMGYDHDTMKHNQHVKYTPTADVHANPLKAFGAASRWALKANITTFHSNILIGIWLIGLSVTTSG